ncbi:hypothetical protein BTVI_130728 [Pitangus sulphuratus]|nr:hypothetical protein BTVI_130728 [Pitangus sulphuratus]
MASLFSKGTLVNLRIGLTRSLVEPPEVTSSALGPESPPRLGTGSFLFLNTSERPSPIILSPWLRSSSDQCIVQVAVYKFYQQSGEYIARVHPIDESSSEILTVKSPEKHGKIAQACGLELYQFLNEPESL